jgi:hypothetical protein
MGEAWPLFYRSQARRKELTNSIKQEYRYNIEVPGTYKHF